MIAEGDITRYIGDAIALVCTRTERALDEVLALIDVDYTELTPVSSPLDAPRGGCAAPTQRR
jgi:CO/xanthine dehydrogenase Mo-binding subunit